MSTNPFKLHSSQETLGSMDNFLDNVEVSSSTSDSNVEDVYEMKENMIVLDNEESHNLVMNNDKRDNDPSAVSNHKTSLSPSNLIQEDNVYQLPNISDVDSSLNINANIIEQCEPIESGDEINKDKFITVQSEDEISKLIQSESIQHKPIQLQCEYSTPILSETDKNQILQSESKEAELNVIVMRSDECEEIEDNDDIHIDNTDGSLLDPNDKESIGQQSKQAPYWEKPIKNKTMLFPSKNIKDNNISEIKSNDSETINVESSETKIEQNQHTPLVEVVIKESPLELSRRITYRPPQPRTIYITPS